MRLYCDCIPTTKKVSDCILTVIMPGLYSDCNCPVLNTVGILYQNSIVVKSGLVDGSDPDNTKATSTAAGDLFDSSFANEVAEKDQRQQEAQERANNQNSQTQENMSKQKNRMTMLMIMECLK